MADNLLAFLWHIFSKVWRPRSYLPSKKTQTTNAKLPDTLVACTYVHRVRHFSVSSPHLKYVKNRKPRHHHIWGQRSMKYRSKLLYTLILSSAAQQTTHTPASHICFLCKPCQGRRLRYRSKQYGRMARTELLSSLIYWTICDNILISVLFSPRYRSHTNTWYGLFSATRMNEALVKAIKWKTMSSNG